MIELSSLLLFVLGITLGFMFAFVVFAGAEAVNVVENSRAKAGSNPIRRASKGKDFTPAHLDIETDEQDTSVNL